MRLPATFRALTAGIIAAGLGFCLAADLPGHLSYDSVIQLLEGRTGAYANWHPPVMSWLLGVTDAVVPGTGLFVALDALLFFASLLSLVLIPRRVSWWAAPVALVCVLTPQLLLYQGIVWKDVLFADAAVAGFICLAQAAARWPNAALRFPLLAAAILLLGLAALARQNGVVIVPVAALALGWIAARHTAERPLISGAAYGGGALAAAILVIAAADFGLSTHIIGDSGPAKQIQLLQSYDIIGAVTDQPGLPLDRIHENDPNLEKLIRTIGVKVYSPERNDTLTNSHVLTDALNNADADMIAAQWRALILGHPWLYLRVRTEVFRWVFLTPDLRMCLPYLVGVSGPDAQMKELGIAPRDDARDEALGAYAGAFVGTPVLSHAAFALLAAVLFVLLVRRRRAPDIAAAALLLAALGFTATFYLISIACDYRYLYFLDTSALAAALYAALDPAGLVNRAPAPGR